MVLYLHILLCLQRRKQPGMVQRIALLNYIDHSFNFKNISSSYFIWDYPDCTHNTLEIGNVLRRKPKKKVGMFCQHMVDIDVGHKGTVYIHRVQEGLMSAKHPIFSPLSWVFASDLISRGFRKRLSLIISSNRKSIYN